MFGNFTIQIKNGKASLNKDIFLSKDDKDVVIYFKVEGFPYRFANSTKDGIEGAISSQVTLQKPSGETISLDKMLIDSNKIVLKITEDIVDEVIEIGEYSFQVRLFDEDNSEISLPIIRNQFHVGATLEYSQDTENIINQSGVGYGHISLSDDVDIFDNDKKYNRTIWNDQDLITTGKMNKIENSLYYLLDNLIINHNVVNNIIDLSLDKYQSVTTDNDLTVNLPVIDFHNEFILYLNASEIIYLTFSSFEKDYVYRLAKGYYKCRLTYIGTWLIEIIMDENNISLEGFATKKEVDNLQSQTERIIEELKTESNDKYAPKKHEHENYIKRFNDTKGLLLKEIDDYKGMITEDGNDTKAIRTTKDGLLPYSGGDSSIGAAEKRFLYGYFSKLISNELNTVKANISNLNIDNEINLNGEGKIKYNPSTGNFELLKNGDLSNSKLALGSININGTTVYIGSEFPANAKENDILIKIDGNESTGGETVITKYTITNRLTNVNTNNTSTSIKGNSSYVAELSPYSGYVMDGITVTMNGVDVTTTVVTNNKINISSVTGNVIITATAKVNSIVTQPNPKLELNASNFTTGSSTWVDLIGDKKATIHGTVSVVDGKVRFDGNKYFVCNISSLSLSNFTVAMKLFVNPTTASSTSAGNNVITMGAGTSTWKDNMSCNIHQGIGTEFYALINGESATGDEATGNTTIILRHDAANKKIILNIGSKKFENTYTDCASTFKYIYTASNTSCDYEYIKLYDTVLTDSQIESFN